MRGYDHQSARVALDAMRRMGVATVCGPDQVHTRLRDGVYRADIGKGLTYRPNPMVDPLAWERSDPVLLEDDEPGLVSTRGDAIVRVPMLASGAFTVTARTWGTLSQRYVGAADVPYERVARNRVVYRDAFVNTDLVVTAGPRGMKVDWVFRGPGHPTTIEVFEQHPPGGLEVEWSNRRGRARMSIRVPFWTDGERVREASVQRRPSSRGDNGVLAAYTLPDMSDVAYPFVFDPTTDFNPDASPESTSVDGYVERSVTSETFATIRGGAGTSAPDSSASIRTRLRASATTDQFDILDRIITLFDTSSLGSTAVVSAVILKLYATSTATGLGSDVVDVVTVTTSFDTALVTGDYAIANYATGTVHGSFATISSWSTSAYNNASLSPSCVNTTGITRLASLLSWDRSGTFGGTWSSGQATTIVVDSADGTNAPVLSVTYTLEVKRVVDETLNLAETVVRLPFVNKVVTEAANLVEGVVRVSGVNRSVQETMNMSEGVVSAYLKLRIITETLQMSESASYLRTMLLVINEALNMVETVAYTTLVRVLRWMLTIVRSRRNQEAAVQASRRWQIGHVPPTRRRIDK